MSEHGVSSLNLHNYQKQVEASMTPYILEERELRVTQMDIFSRLMRDRILWVAGPVNDYMSTIVQAQLMFLDSAGDADITMHIDSPGGSVKSGLSMVDVMDYNRKYGDGCFNGIGTIRCRNQGQAILPKAFTNDVTSIKWRFQRKHSGC